MPVAVDRDALFFVFVAVVAGISVMEGDDAVEMSDRTGKMEMRTLSTAGKARKPRAFS